LFIFLKEKVNTCLRTPITTNWPGRGGGGDLDPNERTTAICRHSSHDDLPIYPTFVDKTTIGEYLMTTVDSELVM
jgi:hypothetical protein